MGMDHAPLTVFFAEDHRRTRNELGVVIMEVARWRFLASPPPPRFAMAPDDRKIVAHPSAHIKRSPVRGLHILSIEFP